MLIPLPIRDALEHGAALAISVSGGKDSHALALGLSALHQASGWRGDCFLIHADLGRIEWPETPAFVQHIATQCNLPLHIVRRRDGKGQWDMVDRWRERGETLKAQGKQPRPWSDAKNRFCTSEMKRDPINRYLRRYAAVISAEGIRAEESTARAKKEAWTIRQGITTQTRLALTWNPLLQWTTEQIWQALGTSTQDLVRRQRLYRQDLTRQALDGWPAHPVYVYGNRRLSCAFCILGCQSDLANAAQHRPQLLEELIAMEEEYGFTFQQGKTLAALRPAAPRAMVQQQFNW